MPIKITGKLIPGKIIGHLTGYKAMENTKGSESDYVVGTVNDAINILLGLPIDQRTIHRIVSVCVYTTIQHCEEIIGIKDKTLEEWYRNNSKQCILSSGQRYALEIILPKLYKLYLSVNFDMSDTDQHSKNAGMRQSIHFLEEGTRISFSGRANAEYLRDYDFRIGDPAFCNSDGTSTRREVLEEIYKRCGLRFSYIINRSDMSFKDIVLAVY